jgi:hypothetical protein
MNTERVARALCKASGRDPDEVIGIGSASLVTWTSWEGPAKKLLEESTDPSEMFWIKKLCDLMLGPEDVRIKH